MSADKYPIVQPKAALKALTSYQIISKLAQDCLLNLRALVKHIKVIIVWVPTHKRVAGNKFANDPARESSETRLTVSDPDLAITKAMMHCSD